MDDVHDGPRLLQIHRGSLSPADDIVGYAYASVDDRSFGVVVPEPLQIDNFGDYHDEGKGRACVLSGLRS